MNLGSTMTKLFARLRQFTAPLPERLRRPTRRGVALSVAWAIATIPLLTLFYTLALIPFTPSISDLRKAKTAKPSVVMSVDGQELAIFKRANRDWVKLVDISPNVVAALIATEDHRFYEHHGLDIKRTFSAVLNTLSGNKQGGSTITQQLARNLYPEDIGRAPTVTRKLKEAITALKIEAIYTKDEILETYLNTVPFLYNAFGIEMAARTYFDKSADTLNVLESATLVGMLKGTSYYNPVLNPERALQRRNTVLDQMIKRQKLPEAQLAMLKKTPLKISFERQDDDLGPAPHATQQLKRWLIEWADRNDYNIYADGLVLRTTLDARLQDMANKALEQQTARLQKISDAEWSSSWAVKAQQTLGGSPRKDLVLAFVRESKEYKAAVASGQTPEQALGTLKALQTDTAFMKKLREDKTCLQAGFMALDPANGHVMAWVGSRDFADDQFDHVQQARRQPGSTFKPFVYGAAFEDGSKPSDTFVDQALEIPLGNGSFWRPGDAGGPSGTSMTLHQGLMYSKNSITAQVMQKVGPAHVAKLARSMGVRQSKLDEVLSLALGTSPVTLKEMVTAYSTLANEGRYIEPLMVTRVEDRNGEVLESFADKAPEAVMSTPVAQTLLDVMRGVIDQGTGTPIRSRYGIRADVAGKTGTTQDNTDGWFILMQPQLVAGAWVGFNDNRVTMGARWGQGAQSALPIVGEFYRLAIKARVIDQNIRFVAPRLGTPEPVESQAEPPAEPQLDASGQLIGGPAALAGSDTTLEPLTPKLIRSTVLDGGAAPEGSWQPAPGARAMTQTGPATNTPGIEPDTATVFSPRDIQPPDRR